MAYTASNGKELESLLMPKLKEACEYVAKKIYEIKLSNKSTPINNIKCREFSTYYDTLWRD